MATRLSDMVDKWMKECKTVKEVCELIMVEQLLETLPTEVRVWVCERKPKSSTAAGELADNYVHARKATNLSQSSGSRKTREKSCEQVQVETKSTSNKQQGRDGASHKNHPPRNASDRRGQRKKQKCFNCKGLRYIAAECPSDAMFCKKRRALIWKSERQPPQQELTLRGEVEGITIGDILLDTGCSQTLVRQELMPNDKVMSGQTSIQCAHGDVIKYPVAYVQIKVGAMEFTVKEGIYA